MPSSAWGPTLSDHRGEDQGTRLARLTARQLPQSPRGPAGWSRFLTSNGRLILAVTLAAVCAAGLLALSQTPIYQSQAVVVAEQPPAAAGSGEPPNMATEEGIVTSGAVLAQASRVLHVPVTTLASGVSVHSPGTTSLLDITYSDPVPRVAQQRAQAIAQAYISYRSAKAGARGTISGAGSTAPSVALITPAPLPTSPSSPNYLIDIGAALIVGLALAIGAAGLRDHLDDRLRGPLDLEAQAAAPVLALIPAFQPGSGAPHARLAVVTAPDSVAAEAYRGLRTRVVQVGTARNAKTLLVTSAVWEDKGTTAANLAAALAESGYSVVLVCADLRWGTAHQLFGLEDGHGLSGFLEGRTSLAEALQATEIPGLSVLPPGVPPLDPAALLQRPAWRSALSDIREQADFVVIEAPPMLAGPDTHPLADLAEMILIVADARRSTRAQVRVAVREFEDVHSKLAGCVLADVGRRHHLRSRRPGPVADGHAPIGRQQVPAGPAEHPATEARVSEAGNRQFITSDAAPDEPVPFRAADDDTQSFDALPWSTSR